MAAPTVPSAARRPDRHPVLRRTAADRPRLLRVVLPRTSAGRRVDRGRAGGDVAAVLDPRTVRQRRAGPLVAPSGDGGGRSHPLRAGSGPGRALAHRHPRWSGRIRVLRPGPAGHEPEPVPAGRSVGGAATHHRPGRVHGGQLGGADSRPGRCAGRRRGGHRTAAAARRALAGLRRRRGSVRGRRLRLRGQRQPRAADQPAGSRTGRRATRPASQVVGINGIGINGVGINGVGVNGDSAGPGPGRGRRAGRGPAASEAATGRGARTADHRGPPGRLRRGVRVHHLGLPELLPHPAAGRPGDRRPRAAGRGDRCRIRPGRRPDPTGLEADRCPGLDDRIAWSARRCFRSSRARSTPSRPS